MNDNTGKTENFNLITHWIQDNHFYQHSVFSKIYEESELKILRLFQKAAIHVPAYKDFLHKNDIRPIDIKSMQDFKKVPFITKENYISKYSLKQKSWNGELSANNMISTSSGTMGEPQFWPRNIKAEIEGAYAHELLLKNIWNIDKVNTLFINGFAMGNWIAGTFTLSCINLLSLKGYNVISMTPGYSLEEVLTTLKNVGPNFDQVIIAGHTPFLKEVVQEAYKLKIIGTIKKIRLLGTGQAITENWREYLLKLLESNNYFDTILNLYGSADASLMGFETPLSIAIHKTISSDQNINNSLFFSERIPSLYQYDPRLTYFEEFNQELLITKDSGIPLIRYNIHDNGGLYSYEGIMKNFKKDQTIEKYSDKFNLPFVYLFGREKFMVKIYGANIYSENINIVSSHSSLQPHITGRFQSELAYDDNNDPVMQCRFELNPGIEISDDLVKLIEFVFVEEVSRVNSEYRDVLTRVGSKAKPKIILHYHNDNKYFQKGKVKKTS